MTGSAHDAGAFEHTGAHKYPEWFFGEGEFAWTDSAYTVNKHTIPVHKEPASFRPENIIFDKAVSHLRVRSEHCMGALKSRWQCLRGLRVHIRKNRDHVEACRWITVCIILHNLIIDVEGLEQTAEHFPFHGRAQEEEDGVVLVPADVDVDEVKRMQLVAEIVAYKGME